MSIIIQNMSKGYGRGIQQYDLRINRKLIAKFEHVFEEGLAVCLRKAAVAAENPNREEIQEDRELIALIHKHTHE